MSAAPASHMFSSMESLLSDVTGSIADTHAKQACADQGYSLVKNGLTNCVNSPDTNKNSLYFEDA